MRTLEEAIKFTEKTANDYEKLMDLDPETLAECVENQRQIAEWLRELVERRKQPEIIHCRECIHKIDIAGQSYVGCLAHGTYPDKEYFCGNAERSSDV